MVGVIKLSKASYRKMVQNLVWATGYNAFAIPLAAGVLALGGVHALPRGRRRADVPVDDRRCGQRPAASAPGPASGCTRSCSVKGDPR